MNVPKFYTPKALVVLALAIWTGLATAATAATAPQPAKTGPSRFLLIVETSGPMQKRITGLSSVLQELLISGMHRQMRPGDTLGVWTFNQDLSVGKLPLQRWSTNPKGMITTVMNHLATETFEKQPDLENVIPAMLNIVKGSESLMVVLVSTGGKISGTPYDEEINRYYVTWNPQQRKERMPFVTVLRATHGALNKYALGTAPWPVEMPPLERPVVRLAKVNAKKLSNPAAPPTTAKVAPLIMIGKKPQPQPLPTTSASAITTAPQNTSAATRATAISAPEPLPEASVSPAPNEVANLTTVPEQKEPAPKETQASLVEEAASTTVATAASLPTAASRSTDPGPSRSAPAAALALPTPPQRWFDPVLGLILLTAFMAGGAIVAWFILRNHRPEISLITRSLQLSNKP